VQGKDIREFIVDKFKRARKPLTLDEIAQRMHLNRKTLEKQLRDSEPLSNFRGLTPAKASKIIEFYGRGVIFSAELEWLIDEGKKSEDRLKEFERKSRGEE
jgi:AraC-like DNA-binding protein